MNILVSACLIGINTKYNGGNNLEEKLQGLMKEHTFVPICPEQLGGLTTPRLPSEIVATNPLMIISKQGEDVTSQFIKGAEESLRIAKLYDCKYAILKERSPSCGGRYRYDGSFQGNVIEGQGVTAELLEKHGIKVFSEENFMELLEK